ncbi:NAD(P)-dependent dehydrogenase (short-subunit alcohol dehydrogenase family) [Variovorax boronicumulans]|uniref:3-ketoacyl-ACP reductase n=1 Tax=Variovorax boronicumulans TaxID=436515 RepID=UPI00339797E5
MTTGNRLGRRPIALVTGGRRGIGRAIVVSLAARGFDIALADLEHDSDAVGTLDDARAAGAIAAFYSCDVSNVDGHAALIHAIEAEMGPIECLVNNAGISVQKRGDLLEITPESFDRLLATNLRGPFFLTQRVAAHMLEQRSPRGYRSIVNVSSANAFAASVNRGEYCISKAAITMATRLFAVRMGEAGIGVFEIRPGVIRTSMTQVAEADYDQRIRDGLTPMPRWGMPEDVGDSVAALAGGAFRFSTGDAIHVDGGLHVQRL